MSSLCMYYCMHAFSLFLHSFIGEPMNDALLQTIPHINEALLQLFDIVQTTFVHSLLHGSPYDLYLIVYLIKVWAVGQPEVGLMKSGVFYYVAAHSEICEFSCYVFSRLDKYIK